MNLLNHILSKKYALAYYLSSGESNKEKEINLKKIKDRVIKNLEYLSHPVLNVETKKLILSKIIEDELKKTLAYNLVETLISHSRVKLMDNIYREFINISLSNNGYLIMDVISRYPVSEEEKKNIIETFGPITGNKKILLNHISDDRIIGGFIIKWDDKLFDSTINRRLELLKNEIEKEMA